MIYREKKLIKISMSSDQSNAFPAPIYSVYGNMNFFHNLGENEIIDIETNFIRNFSYYSLEEGREIMVGINSSNPLDHISYFIEHDPLPYFIVINPVINPFPINSNWKNDSFSNLEQENLLTNSESNSILVEEENLLGKKRSRRHKPIKDRKDNMLVKIKRAFLNIFIFNLLNKELKRIGSTKYFEKFPNNFASVVTKNRNKGIVDKTLGEIFEKKELYIYENEKGLSNFRHNLKIIQSEEIKKNEKFQKLLNKTFRELYIEYLDEFKINEKNRLENKKMDENYLKKYLGLLESLIEFFSH